MSVQATAYALLVDVPSVEVPSIDRVEPFDPDSSYLIDKLDCTAEVLGGTDCMPAGIPFIPLVAASIQEVKDWITAGAFDD